MIKNLFEHESRLSQQRYDEWLETTYEFVKNEFGKEVVYCGVDHIVVGLDIDNTTNSGDKIGSDGFSFFVRSEAYFILKSSFTNEIKISVEEYYRNIKEN